MHAALIKERFGWIHWITSVAIKIKFRIASFAHQNVCNTQNQKQGKDESIEANSHDHDLL